jgi:hypothetical protein
MVTSCAEDVGDHWAVDVSLSQLASEQDTAVADLYDLKLGELDA